MDGVFICNDFLRCVLISLMETPRELHFFAKDDFRPQTEVDRFGQGIPMSWLYMRTKSQVTLITDGVSIVGWAS